MHKSTDSASLAHMAAPWFGERTPQELLAALVPFRGLCNEYRRRFEKDGIALTQDEAVEAYKLVAPLYAPDMTDKEEEAALQADMNAIACRLESGEIVFRGPAVEEILEGFEGMIAKGSDALYITEARGEEDSWSRFVAYKAIEHFVDVLSDDRSRIRIIDEPPRALERAQAILAKLTVTRPRGRYDARLTLRRNGYIVYPIVA